MTGHPVAGRIELGELARVEVLGTDADLAVVVRQIGPAADAGTGADADGTRPADITVRFVDRLDHGPLNLLGKDELAFDDRGLVVLRGKGKRPIKARIPVANLGQGPVTFEVERGAPAVPYLVAAVNLAVLGNGGVALHAAAYELGGRGTVVTGWSKGGKTETVLAALRAGAVYVGDEWIHLPGDGRRAFGLPEPLRVWDWYLDQLDGLPVSLPFATPARVRLLSLAVDGANRLGRARLAHLIDGQRHLDLPPAALIGGQPDRRSTSFDTLLHVVSHDDPGTVLREIEAGLLADRMAASLAYERLPLVQTYLAFRYAFPGERNLFLEEAADLEQERLRTIFAGKPTWELAHPYPPRLDDLWTALGPLHGAGRKAP